MRKGKLTELLKTEEKVKDSVGIICKDCNKNAFYFNRRNFEMNTEKSCLICSKKLSQGIMLEDFVFPLNKCIPEHYENVEKDISESISLREVLSRFTYDDNKVLEKLIVLLCENNPNYFKKEGKYKSKITPKIIKDAEYKANDEWHDISKELKHTRRFTNNKAVEFYEEIIRMCTCDFEKNAEGINSALTEIQKGTSLFRGRIVKNNTHKDTIKKCPEKELAAPPEDLAGSNRMSPSGVSFMYTAKDYETAIAELRPYVSDTIAIGEFVATKDLNFFDFTRLDKMELKEPNLIQFPKNIGSRCLLAQLHSLVSKPVRPTDISYIEIQMFSETIRNHKDGMFNGIIFKSSQRSGGLNYVLFGDYDEEKKYKDYHVALDSDCRVKFYKVTEVITKQEEYKDDGSDEI